MSALIVGATTGVGRALCEALAARGEALVMVSSDARDLTSLATHVELVYGIRADIVVADAKNTAEFIRLIDEACSRLGGINNLYFPIGASRTDDCGLLEFEHSVAIINVNLTIVIALITHFLPLLLHQSHANIVGFGSIASIRGRSSNVVYSAAKRGLESYFESLRHLTLGSGVTTQLYQLGYVATQQSFGKKLLFPVATPQQVAENVLNNLGKDAGGVFYPKYWAPISFIISWLPWSIYKRLNF